MDFVFKNIYIKTFIGNRIHYVHPVINTQMTSELV